MSNQEGDFFSNFVAFLENLKFYKGTFKYYVIKEVGGWGQIMAILSKRWVGLKSQKHDDVILEWSLTQLTDINESIRPRKKTSV